MKAAFFDVDGTLTDDRTWKGFLDYFQHHGLRRGTHLAFLALHYPLYFLHRLRLVSAARMRGQWAADMAWYVRGYTPERAGAVWDWVVERFIEQHWRTDARAILEDHLEAGDVVMLVSGGPQPLTQRIADELGVTHAVANRLETRDGRYTGRSIKPYCIDVYKVSLAKQYLEEHNLHVDLSSSYAYADSLTDLPMLEMVGNPVAVCPFDDLRLIAQQRGWRIFPG
jgi:HAD superfamily hydrolase (TIGR01490 family)